MFKKFNRWIIICWIHFIQFRQTIYSFVSDLNYFDISNDSAHTIYIRAKEDDNNSQSKLNSWIRPYFDEHRKKITKLLMAKKIYPKWGGFLLMRSTTRHDTNCKHHLWSINMNQSSVIWYGLLKWALTAYYRKYPLSNLIIDKSNKIALN